VTLIARAPRPSLRPYVRSFHAWTTQTAEPIEQREFSFGDVVLVVNVGTPVRVRDPRRPEQSVAPQAFIGGVDDSYAVTEHDGASSGIQATLSPLGARAIFGIPMRELARAVVSLDDLLRGEARVLVERLQEERSWQERIDLLEAALTARAAAASPPPADAAHAWHRLNETYGSLRVEALARELGCSRRHLAARFRDHVGLPPKTTARILRFRRAVRLMLRNVDRWADVAYACGYSDQPHLNRDFRQFVGTSPSAYLAYASSVTYLQDAADEAV
jgi:AraC-like DNA-binding protein